MSGGHGWPLRPRTIPITAETVRCKPPPVARAEAVCLHFLHHDSAIGQQQGGPGQKWRLVIQRGPALGASEGECKQQGKTYSEFTVHFPSFWDSRDGSTAISASSVAQSDCPDAAAVSGRLTGLLRGKCNEELMAAYSARGL